MTLCSCSVTAHRHTIVATICWSTIYLTICLPRAVLTKAANVSKQALPKVLLCVCMPHTQQKLCPCLLCKWFAAVIAGSTICVCCKTVLRLSRGSRFLAQALVICCSEPAIKDPPQLSFQSSRPPRLLLSTSLLDWPLKGQLFQMVTDDLSSSVRPYITKIWTAGQTNALTKDTCRSW